MSAAIAAPGASVVINPALVPIQSLLIALSTAPLCNDKLDFILEIRVELVVVASIPPALVELDEILMVSIVPKFAKVAVLNIPLPKVALFKPRLDMAGNACVPSP